MFRLNPYHTGPVTDHFDGRQFYNPGEPETDRGFRDVLRWLLEAPNHSWPKQIEIQPAIPKAYMETLTVTMVGHSTVLIQINGLNLLTDPVWSDRVSPFRFTGPKRVCAPGVSLDDLPPIDAILLTHNHYDHCDIETLRHIHDRYRPLIITPLGNDIIIRKNLPDAHITTGDWGDCVTLGQAEIHIVPANHWSGRGLRDRRLALWCGFMIRAAGKLIYFAGDTGYGTGSIFRTMRQQFGAPDLALLPCGAYDPRWFMAPQHVDPEEAIQIMCDLNAGTALGMHWGVFKLTDEARNDPSIRLAKELLSRRITPARFQPMQPGDVAQIA